ncbi:DUF5071 domain-containing protein [Aquimarina sp. 2304DJ70-9]|uniref:DUF5071 domain-containing protein n=1 Tax=Aquimarina penaris TaxID=3231044 RepID=UPI003462E1D4
MNTSDHVYILQAMRFWLDDMHRKNYERIGIDPDDEEFMMQVSMNFDKLFEEYQQAYDPNTNMVNPELLKWEAWKVLPQWPEDLASYFPEDKSAVEKARALMQLPFETIEPCLPILLTWLQDVNWPIAAAIVKPLRMLKEKLVPALKEVVLMAIQTEDHFWAYNLVQQLINELSTEDIRPLENELCRLVNSEDEELGVMALMLLSRHNLWNTEMIQKWAKIKRGAYAEWVKELDQIID